MSSPRQMFTVSSGVNNDLGNGGLEVEQDTVNGVSGCRRWVRRTTLYSRIIGVSEHVRENYRASMASILQIEIKWSNSAYLDSWLQTLDLFL